MGNKIASSRTLTVQQVIDLVQSVDIPVLRIEKEVGIPASVLQRSLKLDTLKPLPVKYEEPLKNYIKLKLGQARATERSRPDQNINNVPVAQKKETSASPAEVENKNKWLNDVRAAVRLKQSSVPK